MMWDALSDPAFAGAVVREAPYVVLLLERDGSVRLANPAAAVHLGYELDELPGMHLTQLIDADDAPRAEIVLQRAIDGERTDVSVRYIRKDGEPRFALLRVVPWRPGGGPTESVLVFAFDTTDEELRTDALRESDQRFRNLVSAFDRAFFVMDIDLRIAGLFGRWVRTTGLVPANWIGYTPQELFPETGGEPHVTQLTRVLEGEDVTYEWAYPNAATGDLIQLRLHASPMRDAQEGVIGIAVVVVDITRRVRAEAEATALRARIAAAERAEALGQLVSGVAHELNNPLAAMLNFTEDLLLGESDPERRSALEVIRAQALRSRVIVRDLLTFARRGGNRPRIPHTPGPILSDVVRALRPGLGEGVRLDAEIGDGGMVLAIDRAGFEQVITNLLTNAAQATGPGGHVLLRAGVRGPWYEIEVLDDGHGMAPDVLSRLFEPFFTTKSTGQGVGLGLSVSLGIVQEHGGTLTASNRTDAPGAVFTVRFPVPEVPLELPPPPLPRTSVPTARRSSQSQLAEGPVLLIVDDEEPIRRALRRFFERRGWIVEEAHDGLEGDRLLSAPDAAQRYVAILCDLRMPGLDGPELYARVKERTPELVSRFVISTGDVVGEQAAAFLASIDAPVLEKPYELGAVDAIVERLRVQQKRRRHTPHAVERTQ
ncbi:MAG: PAS domain-containing protein [Gemmatimonadaceae bacterium]